MATEEELVVLITAKDELSRQAAAAKKSVSALAKEVEEARKAVEKGGDPANYEGLRAKLEEEQRAWARLTIARDKAGRELRDTQREVTQATSKMSGAWKRLQGVFKNPLFTAATIAGVTLFGKRAVEAFAQAEQSQLKLVEAYRKFDAIGNVPIESMRALASELQSLTGTDDDLLAAAAGTLARFELTGDAIQRLLPLVNDFAILTGRDVVDASEAIGKAFMGNTRALKELGIDFRATGDRGADFEAILLALQEKAGGAGDAFGETAQGGLARAQAAFGDLQEEIGGTLVPALTAMLRVVEPAAKFFSGLPGPIKGTAIAIGILSAAVLAIGPRIAVMITGMKAAGIEATAMKGKMSAAGAFIAGPWGVALAAGAVALTYFLTEQAEASARVDAFAESIDTATGRLNQAGMAKVAETLMGDISQEDWQILEKFGFTVESVTATVVGGADAWEAFRNQKAAAVNRAGIGKERELLSILETNVRGLREDVEDGTRAWEASRRAMDIASRSTEDLGDNTQDLYLSAGRVRGALREANPVLGEYRDAAYSASGAAEALKVANQRAAAQADRLTGALQGVADEVARQEAMANYRTALKTFLEDPSAETAGAVATAMSSAAQSIEDPGERAEFTRSAIDKIRETAQKAGYELNPALDASLQKARGQAVLLDRQIDQAVRARTVQITMRFSDSRETYNNGQRHGGWAGGWVGGGSGGPTSDTIPTMLSRGEYVLRGGAAAALRQAVGDAGLWALNHADRSMPNFLDAAMPAITVDGNGQQSALVGAGAPVINIGEIKADSGIDVQTEVMWALRRAERIKRERR